MTTPEQRQAADHPESDRQQAVPGPAWHVVEDIAELPAKRNPAGDLGVAESLRGHDREAAGMGELGPAGYAVNRAGRRVHRGLRSFSGGSPWTRSADLVKLLNIIDPALSHTRLHSNLGKLGSASLEKRAPTPGRCAESS